ncbi:MAG: c-type cytochrome, partial [Vulcanimicrobiaceae bacterium]
FVTGDATKVIHVVLDGLHAPITVNGQKYDGQMPAWKGNLSNSDIAAVITYIRKSWGNSAGPVTEAEVAKQAK